MKKLSKNLAFILNNIKESGLLNEARVGQQGIKARLRTGLISDDSKEKWLQTKEKMGKDFWKGFGKDDHWTSFTASK